MNKKIFFDLCTYDLDVFKSKDVIFLVGVTYFVDIFIVKKSLSFDFRKVKTIPFTLLKTEDRDEIIQDLYYNIFTSISYCEVGCYSDQDGVYYDKAFYICISKYGL
jgi:hypothetical protein